MRSRWIRRVLSSALLGMLIVSASPAGALVDSFRELRPFSFNTDGSANCGKWCGLLESCC